VLCFDFFFWTCTLQFIFAPDGLIIFAVINAPGSIHDSTLAEWGDFYSIMDEIHDDCAGKCCMDSAFAGTRNAAIIRSSEDVYGKNALEVLINREATSLRQAAEWRYNQHSQDYLMT
jgi:hypothetical protein